MNLVFSKAIANFHRHRQAEFLQSIGVGACRGGGYVSDQRRRAYTSVFRGRLCLTDQCRRSYSSVYRGSFYVRDLWRRRDISICRAGVCASDLGRSFSWRLQRRCLWQRSVCEASMSYRTVK